jgi:hypothetical protein
MDTAAGAGVTAFLCIWYVVYFLIIALYIAGMWKMFVKAGKPGWAAIIPIYNIIILCEVAGRPGWWVLLFLIPIVNIVVIAMISIDVAASFGKGTGFGIGLWLLGFIFYPMLGFGDARYIGPAAAPQAPAPPPVQ